MSVFGRGMGVIGGEAVEVKRGNSRSREQGREGPRDFHDNVGGKMSPFFFSCFP